MSQETTEQLIADMSARIREAIGPNVLYTAENRAAIGKIISDALTFKHYDFQVECTADVENHILHVSFRAPAGFYTPEQIEELKACGAVIEEVKPCGH